MVNIVFFLSFGLLGYVIGRWADNYLNFWIGDPHWVPDHWIYGLLLMIISLFIIESYWAMYIFSFGLGHFISDLKDFLNLKFYGSDNKDKSQRRFWHID
ncbi:MAG: hypothetical protein Q7S77_01045 [Candidatus Staskawiczbacteria bacterium]|nr:hypothetical protein [Candidatus Staskawiczbacteria bacterium]